MHMKEKNVMGAELIEKGLGCVRWLVKAGIADVDVKRRKE